MPELIRARRGAPRSADRGRNSVGASKGSREISRVGDTRSTGPGASVLMKRSRLAPNGRGHAP